MKPLLLSAALSFATAVSLYAQTNTGVVGHSTSDPLILTTGQSAMVQADNTLALQALRSLNKQNPADNFFFSTVGMTTALGVAINATSGNTAQQIRQSTNRDLDNAKINEFYSFLIWSLDRNEGFALGLDNSVWVDKRPRINPQFAETIAKHYLGSVHRVAADSLASEANDWIRERSEGRIYDIVSGAGDGGVTIANASWFRGTWRNEFAGIYIYRGKFRPGNETKAYEVDYMTSVIEFPYYDDIPGGVEYAEFPFADESPLRAVSMIVVLPRTARSLDKIVETQLTPEKWEYIISQMFPRRLKVSMPVFSISTTTSLKPLLEEFGIQRLFGQDAEMSPMSDSGGLFVDDIIQGATISVDKDGVEALPLNIEVRPGLRQAGRQNLVPFTMNRPFVFVIRDRNTGAILFIGKVIEAKN